MYIEIDDLIGNAFIVYLEATNKRVISFNKINKFGACIVHDLNSRGVNASLKLSSNLVNQFFYDYSDWFKTVQNGKETLIVLDEKVTSKELCEKFSGYLSVEVFLAFNNSKNIKVLVDDEGKVY